MVVVVPPDGKDAARMAEVVENLLVQAFVSQAAVEALDEAVLLRFTGSDVVPSDPSLVLPLQDRPIGRLGAVLADDGPKLVLQADDGVEFADDPSAEQGRIRDEGQVLARVVVDAR